MAKIFINYRRKDSAPYAGRLYDRLASHFGHDHVFMDIDQIEPGEVFDQVIQDKLKAVQAAVVLIGPRWLDIAEANGQRRLDDPDDWVRLEIAALLERGIRVIPVLVGGATLPKSMQLPECLVPLTRRQAIEITDHRFHADADKLIKVLEKIMGVPPASPAAEPYSVTISTTPMSPTQLYNPSLKISRSTFVLSVVVILLASVLWDYFPKFTPELKQQDVKSATSTNLAVTADWVAAPPIDEEPSVIEQPIDTFPENKAAKKNYVLEQPTENKNPAGQTEKYSTTHTVTTNPILTDVQIVEPLEKKEQPSSMLEAEKPKITNIPIPKKKNLPAQLIEANFAEKTKQIDPPVTRRAFIEPQMVRIPPGKFLMGSNDGDSDEKPVHEVAIAYAFEIGKYEVTFDEYDAFANATGRQLPNDNRWGRGKRPVINVSWNDVQAYVQWLSKQTGKQYRPPTEAEWEYAARAGTQARYWWGDDFEKNNAACWECGNEWYGRKRIALVGSFKANAFGLHDTAGNVWEWTQDCWHDNYRNAPGNGSAWLEKGGGDCNRRVFRGGSWIDSPQNLRSAIRNRMIPGGALHNQGFRIARDL
ncbi:MAG: SUMF1/EgtB/PvdO family nonheme iron enzyme [Nitrosomonas sp.]|nr:SUMF1/EgtB/PvdO family nonheme iron enzyme [Nitrosomonas sp.]